MTRDEAEHIYEHVALAIDANGGRLTRAELALYISGMETGVELAAHPAGPRLREAFALVRSADATYLQEAVADLSDAIDRVSVGMVH